MTSPTGMRGKNNQRGFTLVELILVMALLVIFLAISAPSITRSFAQDALKREAKRLLALTEYARNEAVSQGVPMVVWIDSQTQAYGIKVKDGYGSQTSPGQSGLDSLNVPPAREKEFLPADGISFELWDAKTGRDGLVILTEIGPEGIPSLESLSSVRVKDRSERAMDLVLSEDGWGYELWEGEGN